MDSKSHGIILTTFTAFLVACYSTEQKQFDDLPGPCVIRRTKLPRLEPVKVGYVRQIELTKDEKPFTVKTLSVRPPIFGRYTASSRKISSTSVQRHRLSRTSVHDNVERYCA